MHLEPLLGLLPFALIVMLLFHCRLVTEKTHDIKRIKLGGWFEITSEIDKR